MKTETNIVVRLTYEALHCWPECPIHDVDFLRHPHRHVFHIEIEKAVSHSDRDVEIIMFKRRVLAHLQESFKGDLGRMSCEDLAELLLIAFQAERVQVLEDNENGAVIRRLP